MYTVCWVSCVVDFSPFSSDTEVNWGQLSLRPCRRVCVCVCTCACVSFITRLTQVSHTEIERFAKLEQKPKLFLNFYFQNRDNTFFFFFFLNYLNWASFFFFFFWYLHPLWCNRPPTLMWWHVHTVSLSQRICICVSMHGCVSVWVCERTPQWELSATLPPQTLLSILSRLEDLLSSALQRFWPSGLHGHGWRS